MLDACSVSHHVYVDVQQRDERRRNLGHKKASTASGTPEQQHQEASQAPGEGAGKDGVAEGVQRGHLAEGAGVGGAGPVVVDMEVDMEVGEPKRQAVDGAVDPPGKKPRPAAEVSTRQWYEDPHPSLGICEVGGRP